MCKSQIFKIELGMKIRELDLNLNLTFLHFKNFLITAFALRAAVVKRDRYSICPTGRQVSPSHPFKG
jgi:hypothetical protein